VVERFANGVKIMQHTCPGLVEQIEGGNISEERTQEILTQALSPMLAAGIDTVVLGCTHYPFVIPLIQEIVGPGVRVIDPAPAIARQVGRLLDEGQLRSQRGGKGETRYLTSGDLEPFNQILPVLGFNGQAIRVDWGKELLLD
jgi:glutamate racemase